MPKYQHEVGDRKSPTWLEQQGGVLMTLNASSQKLDANATFGEVAGPTKLDGTTMCSRGGAIPECLAADREVGLQEHKPLAQGNVLSQ